MMIYFISNLAIYWLTYNCEEPINLARIEQDYEGCQYIPLKAFEDLLTKETLDRMVSELKTIKL